MRACVCACVCVCVVYINSVPVKLCLDAWINEVPLYQTDQQKPGVPEMFTNGSAADLAQQFMCDADIGISGQMTQRLRLFINSGAKVA